MAEHVCLGLAGDLVSDVNTVDLYTTKVGGAPVYPGAAVPEAAASQLHCSLCSSQLSLVIQAYAPHPSVAERVILVFGCTKLGCGKSAECWKALRCQLQQQQNDSCDQLQHKQPCTVSHSQQQFQPDQQSPPPPPLATAVAPDICSANTDWGAASDWGNSTAAAANPWAAAGSSDFATADDSTVTTLSACNAFDFSDLTSSLEAAAQQAAARPKARSVVDHTAAAAAEDAAAAAVAVCCRGSTGLELPEFHLYAEAEPGDAAAKTINQKDLQRVQQLLQEYEAQEAGTATTATSSSSSITRTSSRSAAPMASSSSPAAAVAGGVDSEDGASWAGESYEKDEIRGVDRGYLKFSKRLQWRPEQCVRYCLDGQVLWPKAPPQPTPCSRCGGPRVFELQLMPALIPMVIEAGQMRQDQHLRVDHRVIDAVANWDWCTIAVFTCQASCSSRSPGPMLVGTNGASDSATAVQCDSCFEEVLLINEQDCHTALTAPYIELPAAGSASTEAAADDEDAELEGDSRGEDEDR